MRFRRTLYASAFLATAAAAFFAPDAAAYINRPQMPVASSVVKIIVSDGHGSAVHIGNGSLLTAAHVVGDAKTVSIKTSGGKSIGGKVLWSSKEYDIAMLSANGDGIASSSLTCRVAQDGERVSAVGNPMRIEFVTAHGRISGQPREVGPLKSAYVTDMTTVMGMSGGPVFDADGNIIGINSAVQLASIEGSTTLTGFGFVVPSADICKLLGRVQ